MTHHILRPGGTSTAAGARARALHLAAPAVLCMLALPLVSGCGKSETRATPSVASLPTSQTTSQTTSDAAGTSGTPSDPAKTPSSPDAGPADGDTSRRPQERLDDTPEERAALIHAWDQCLVDHGAHWTTTRPGVAGAPATVADPIPPAASSACKNKLPLMPPELDPALNPHYRDDMLANIKCLRAHGVMVHLTSDTSVNANGLSWTYDSSDTPLPPNQGQIEDKCQMEAFGGGKGQ
ncbi:hypothetical protein [Peterkaempfera griseoplana]|uniref:hypothetical protein n=1 Tax=Peterkaempfera griseoplana TaxID=66896 RepID=UPI0006E2307B|nr:hypothetical protein [Peterkaempfera griseoplana]